MKTVASKRRSETAVRFGYKMVCLAAPIAGKLAARLITLGGFLIQVGAAETTAS